MSSPGVTAQLCNGSLGDPVVNITFGSPGSGGGTGYAPPGAYTYSASTCPDDGFYTITSATSGCFGNSWHSVLNDHTGGGNFMLVNASYTPGDFFVATVTDLCPNTTYEFAAWIMNVMIPNGISPNVTFRIEKPDGTVLGQYNTGDIPSSGQPSWQQYGLFFTTPPNNAEIILRMTNNAPGGIGNDLALDDITFRPCGGEVTATVAGNTDTIHICEGDTDIFSFSGAASSVYLQPAYQWQVSLDEGITWSDMPGADQPGYLRQPSGTGQYWYRLTVSEEASAGITACRIASNIIVIHVHPKPLVNAGPDRVLLSGDSATLQANVEGEDPSFSWSPPDYISDILALRPAVSPFTGIEYTLTAVSSYGCINSDEVYVNVVTGIFVPNAFTPNNDGRNDTWRIPYLDPEWGAVVQVYNRWGQLVYRAGGTAISWDGKLDGADLPAGTYVYLLQLSSPRRMLKGTLTLIR